MDKVTAILNFAAQHADYWNILLADGDLPTELSADERRGLTAARAHIEEGIVDLLHLCGNRLLASFGSRMRQKTFYSVATVKNQKVTLYPPNGMGPILWHVEFSLWGDEATKTPVCLWSTIATRKGKIPAIVAKLDAASVASSVSGYLVSAAPLRLSTDVTFADLATAAVESMTRLIEGAT